LKSLTTILFALSLAAGCAGTDSLQESDPEDSGSPNNAVDSGSDAGSNAGGDSGSNTTTDMSASMNCDGVTCSGEGRCRMVLGSPVCECNAGFVANGLQCDPIPSGECENNAVDDQGLCDIWILRRGAGSWVGFELDPNGTGHAPGSAIQAAADLENGDTAFVFTDSAIHVLEPSTLDWSPARALSEFAPGLPSATRIIAGYSVPPMGNTNTENITLLAENGGESVIWLRDYNPLTDSFDELPDTDFNGVPFDWEKANAPAALDVRASWLDLDNERGWATVSPQDLCGASGTEVVRYGAFLTALSLHIQELGQCSEFEPPQLVGMVDFLGLPGAPAPESIGAAFWHDGGLYLFRGE
jgi:hypothetical protein